MKKAFVYFLLFGTICIVISGCSKTQYHTSSVMPRETSIPISERESLDNSYDMIINFFNIDIPVILTTECKVDNIVIDGYWLSFNYEVGDLKGEANLRLSYGRLDNMWAVDNDFKDMLLVFTINNEKVTLSVSWCTADNIEGLDTFKLDKKANIWYYLWPNSDISPVSLTEEESIKYFPNNKIYENKYYTTFICDTPIYDVNFYRVTDSDMAADYGPDILLAHYDEYSNENIFFWQTDEMYNWHVSIEYKDSMGEKHIFSYITKRYRYMDPTIMVELKQPDWNIESDGEVYIENFEG